jgi:hypothetical protein
VLPAWDGTRLLLLQQISSKSPAIVAVIVNPPESGGTGLAERPHPLFRLIYQVEIRSDQFPHRKFITRSQLLTRMILRRDCGNSGVVT